MSKKKVKNEVDLSVNFPVNHLSPSAIRTYLTDRYSFFKRYVLLLFEDKSYPAMVEGSIFHSCLSDYYSGNPMRTVDELMKGYDGVEIDWGKTGSKEKSIKNIHQSLELYFNDRPSYKVKDVELRVVSQFEYKGVVYEIPLKGFIDLVVEENDEMVLVDHKLVSSFTDQNNVSPAYEIAACAYYFLAGSHYGYYPKKMYYDEIKKSKNQNGGNQVNRIEIEFTEELLDVFVDLYSNIVEELSRSDKFLPNPYDMMSGQEIWKFYKEAVLNGVPEKNNKMEVENGKSKN